MWSFGSTVWGSLEQRKVRLGAWRCEDAHHLVARSNKEEKLGSKHFLQSPISYRLEAKTLFHEI